RSRRAYAGIAHPDVIPRSGRRAAVSPIFLTELTTGGPRVFTHTADCFGSRCGGCFRAVELERVHRSDDPVCGLYNFRCATRPHLAWRDRRADLVVPYLFGLSPGDCADGEPAIFT